jgi:predicted ATPase
MEELNRMNDELLRRRAAVKAEAMMQFGDKLLEINGHVKSGDYKAARLLAKDLRDTCLFSEVVKIFRDNPETFHCNLCGEKNIQGLRFKDDALTWTRLSLCEECEEREAVREREEGKRLYADFIERNMPRILKAVGVEGILLRASYEGFPNSIIQACKRSVMARSGLYIHGSVGTGKTWLSVATLKDLIKSMELPPEIRKNVKRDVSHFRAYFRFVYVNWLLMIIKSTYDDNDSETEQSIITEYTNIPVLILDDIGAERPTEWVREKLNMIIYFRNNKGLKTIFTSNYTTEELQERLDERISSRIHHQCEVIGLTGPDRRRT